MVFISLKFLLTSFVGVMVCLGLGSVRSASIGPSHCREPYNFEQLKKDLHYKSGKHESHYLVPHSGGAMPTLKDVVRATPEYVNISINDYWPSQMCPKENQLSQIDPSQKNSTCPWTFVLNFDFNRYPMEIMEAKCICKNCLDFLDGKQTLNLCQPVIYTARVLRRTGCNTRGYYVYETTLEPIKAGCMCTSATLNESGQATNSGPKNLH